MDVVAPRWAMELPIQRSPREAKMLEGFGMRHREVPTNGNEFGSDINVGLGGDHGGICWCWILDSEDGI